MDFNPRAPRGARPEYNPIENYDRKISIHVPREGHDDEARYGEKARQRFQSTCPARGTTRGCILNAISQGISIHVPREGHDAVTTGDFARMAIISIHVPREGHDHCRVKRRMSRE